MSGQIVSHDRMDLAVQIADGLDGPHSKGVMYRALPELLMRKSILAEEEDYE